MARGKRLAKRKTDDEKVEAYKKTIELDYQEDLMDDEQVNEGKKFMALQNLRFANTTINVSVFFLVIRL